MQGQTIIEKSQNSASNAFNTSVLSRFKDIVENDKNHEKSLFLNIKEDFLHKITKRVALRPSKPITLGVAGLSASGKTTFVNNLVSSLQKMQNNVVTVVTCDNYFIDTAEELKQAGSFQGLLDRGFNFDIPDALDLDLLKSHIKNLVEKREICCPKYNFITCESKQDGEIKRPAPLIIVEGLFTLNPKLRDIFDIGVYVQAPSEIIKQRWYIRAESRGKTGSAADEWFKKTMKEAQTHIKPTENSSDITVNGLVHPEYIEKVATEFFNIF
ncbi:MAG: hypothetical protein PHV68_04410 [Candidatus Gastranaerophilales bacterium]|nr:hypothetical protein [Candidatus Gastranaerophilales bacterium]